MTDLTRAPTPLYNEKVLCGLGRNVLTTGRLNEEAVARALAALGRFRVLCQTMRVRQVFVLATAAARDAENGPDFLRAAEAACGQEIQLLSGRREAELSALGVVSGFHAPNGVVGDMGGGSLELVDVRGAVVGQGVTMPLGGLALQDLSGGSVKKAAKIVREYMRKAAPQLETLRGRTFYAVGGTWRAIARLHQAARGYPVHVMHGYAVEPTDELSFLQVVEQTDVALLQDVDAISEARRPLLAYGAVVLEEIIRVGRPREVAISASGVREGLLFEQLDRDTRLVDPLLASASEFNVLRARSPRHGEELIAWTDRFVATLDGHETADERRLRHAGCLLSDVGWRGASGLPRRAEHRGDPERRLRGRGSSGAGLSRPGGVPETHRLGAREGERDAPQRGRSAPVRARAPPGRAAPDRLPDLGRHGRRARTGAAHRRGWPRGAASAAGVGGPERGSPVEPCSRPRARCWSRWACRDHGRRRLEPRLAAPAPREQ